MKYQIIDMLREGDLRSIGQVPQVIEMVLENNHLFESLVMAITTNEPGVRMRASDAIEKITRQHPQYLKPYKDLILNQVSAIPQQEVQWHIAQILPRMDLSDQEVKQASEILFDYLDSPSKIVQANAITALVDLAQEEPHLIPKVKTALTNLLECGSPAVKNRAGKLLSKLVRKPGESQS
jgi:HEAT repeat protein